MPTEPSVVGLILAAGASSRMGAGLVKALLPYEGVTFLDHGLRVLRAGGCHRVWVVSGAHPLPASERGDLVHNSLWRQGPLSSLQCGLRTAMASSRFDAVIVHHVERPRVRDQTLAALVAAYATEPGIWQPTHHGRSGHPLLWPRDQARALLALDPDTQTARDLLARPQVAARRRKLAVDDPGVIENIDTPEAYAGLLALSS